MNEICRDVEAELHLIPITKETLSLKSANSNDDSRLDIKAKGFSAFFDLRIKHVNSASQKNKSTATIFRQHEEARKREYPQSVLEVQNGTFTPLVFEENGGMGDECQRFKSHLSSSLAIQTGDSYAEICTWLRTRLSIEILKSAITCLRGSQVPFRVANNNIEEDFQLMNIESETNKSNIC